MILTTVMFVLFITVLGGTQLLQHGSTAEGAAIEASLAQSRAYWAMRGHMSYTLSRLHDCSAGDPDCTNAERVTSLNTDLDLIATDAANSVRLWEYGAQYDFNVQSFVDPVLDDPVIANTDEDTANTEITLYFEVVPEGGTNDARFFNLVPVVRPLNIEVCYGLTTYQNVSCPANNGTDDNGVVHILSFTRDVQASPPAP